MIKAAEKASKSVIRDFGEVEKLQVSKKGPYDFVTKTDKNVEKILIIGLGMIGSSIALASKSKGIKVYGFDISKSRFWHSMKIYCISWKDERWSADKKSLQAINKLISKEINKTKFSKIGIIGSGLMGHGIGFVSALSGMSVALIDLDQNKANLALDKIDKLFQEAVQKKQIQSDQSKKAISSIQATDDLSCLGECDLIVEAVFEDISLKEKVIERSEEFINGKPVFASNTSTIPISRLSKKSRDPERFIGIHFFSPVNKMRLVEIIKGDKTSSETLAKAFDYVLQLNKIPIVVNDKRGFYTTRVFERYAKEGLSLLMDGVSPQHIESAGMQAGFPVGPLAVVDEISISLLDSIRNQEKIHLEAEGKQYRKGPWDEVIDIMIKKLTKNMLHKEI